MYFNHAVLIYIHHSTLPFKAYSHLPSTANFSQEDHEEILQVRLHIQLQNHLIGGHVLQPLGWAPDGAPGNGASAKRWAICQFKGLDVLDGGSGLSKSESRELQLG